MDLEWATTPDMIEELRRRGARFVFVGMQQTNRTADKQIVWVAGQGTSPADLLRLMKIGSDRFTQLCNDEK